MTRLILSFSELFLAKLPDTAPNHLVMCRIFHSHILLQNVCIIIAYMIVGRNLVWNRTDTSGLQINLREKLGPYITMKKFCGVTF